jgi:hypothetical protein
MESFAREEFTAEEQGMFNRILDSIELTFRLTDLERATLEQDPLIRLLSLLPYFAECPEPERLGYLNLSTYISERRGGKQYFLHLPEDDTDYLSRLAVFARIMDGGDPAVIDKGLSLAAMVMLNEYLLDQDEDLQNGKYNPLNSGTWNFTQAMNDLQARVHKTPVARMDVLFVVSFMAMTWWQPF